MTPTATTRQSRRAFSLIELLIVILIISLVIALVLPALAATRKGARNAATRNLMVQVSQACSSFQLSERKLPGYFTEQEMGSQENGGSPTGVDGRGFTEMENVMFDLAGGVTITDSAHPAWYGPTAGHMVTYDKDMVGVASAGSKAYFTPPTKYYKFQNNVDGGDKSLDPSLALYHKEGLRDLVDAEGTPILMWRVDQVATQPVVAVTDFAKQNTTGGLARFYWSANSAFLKSGACGAKRRDQLANSLIGGGNGSGSPPANAASLAGVLGNPSSPVNVTANPILPSAPRGQFVIHAAGSDAMFLAKADAPGAGDRGGKLVTNNTIDYGLNFRGQPAKDLMSDFDDIMISGG
jgi:prepilin-type N-terminal cleavage/methylation domain-containing protein